MPKFALTSAIFWLTAITCSGRLDLGNQNQVGRFGDDLLQIFEPQRKLVDAHHALALQKVDGAQRVAHQQSRRILLVGVDGVFEIENDGIRSVQRGIDEILGLAAGNVKPRPPHAIARRRLRKRKPLREHARAFAQSCAPGRGFNARRNHKRKRALVVDRYPRVPHAEGFEHFFGLPANGIAVVRLDARFEFDVDAAMIARFNPNVDIRANLRPAVSRLACVLG